MEAAAYADAHQDLVESCRLGDRKAQYSLYKLYVKAMYNAALRITGDAAEAEDVVQESFLAAFGNLAAFKGESTFGSWLKRIVVNNALTVLRKRRLDLQPLADWDGVAPADEVDEEAITFQVAQVRAGIEKLPAGYRVVLSLYLLEGYDHREIADILSISEATSKTQYLRAKKKLLVLLGGNSDE